MLGAGLPISVALSDVIERHMQPGISPHLVICSVQGGRVEFTTNNQVGLTPGAPSRHMPPIARTWREWRAFKEEHGLADMLTDA